MPVFNPRSKDYKGMSEQISEERLQGYCILVAKILLQIKKRKRPKLEEV